MSKSKRWAAGLLAVMVLGLLGGCGSKDPEPITEYTIGEETVPAMPSAEDVQVMTTTPDTYGYVGVEDSAALVQDYVASMTGEDSGFSLVNALYHAAEAPDYSQDNGTVYLSKEAVEDGKILVLKVDWHTGTATVEVSLVDTPADYGAAEPAEEEEEPAKLTHAAASDFVMELTPSVLGLEGVSMANYHCYIRNGLVMVNDLPCLWVEIYSSSNQAGTNANAGTYYLSRDGEHLYRLGDDGKEVEELNITD